MAILSGILTGIIPLLTKGAESWLKTIRDLQGKATGYKWIEAAISLVRAVFGYSAALIFVASAVNLWQNNSPLLTQAEFAETFSAILFYFFAERSVKKAFGKD